MQYRRRTPEEIATATSKKCPVCNVDKPLSDFGIDRSRAGGLTVYCRDCHRAKVKDASRRAREKDGGKSSREKTMASYYRHRAKRLAARRAWEKANPEKHAAEKLRWQKRRAERDPTWRMMRNISRHVAGVLNGEKRGRATTDLLGYTAAELRAHVERLFQPGMTWENYGDWHLDHRRPKASFDFKDPNALRECWALENLQPLWGLDNRIKGAHWPTSSPRPTSVSAPTRAP